VRDLTRDGRLSTCVEGVLKLSKASFWGKCARMGHPLKKSYHHQQNSPGWVIFLQLSRLASLPARCSILYLFFGLTGQCHKMFCFWFFHESVSPQPPRYPIRNVSNFFENSRRYSQVKVHHRNQRHRWQICHCYQQHRRQILPPVSLVLLIPLANNGNNIRLLRP
jgi:hypothetical protein